jgi:hypothetical protein
MSDAHTLEAEAGLKPMASSKAEPGDLDERKAAAEAADLVGVVAAHGDTDANSVLDGLMTLEAEEDVRLRLIRCDTVRT